jgi:hypothetical protein
MALGFRDMFLEALLVRSAGAHRDMRLQSGLKALLNAVGLVQILDQLRVTGRYVSHLDLLLLNAATPTAGTDPGTAAEQQ